MIQQIVAIVLEFWRVLAFWAILDAEHVGFIRRLGAPSRNMRTGWNWKWPILEKAETEDARDYSFILDPQSLRSLDHRDLVLQLSVTGQVVNARRYLLSVTDGRNQIQDVAAGALGALVPNCEAEDVLSGAVLELVLERIRPRARRWGLRITDVQFINAAVAPSYRLWSSNFQSAGQD